MKREFHLIVDVGNSTTVFGLFEDKKYIASVTTNTRLDNDKVRNDKLYNLLSDFKDAEIKDGMIFSVVPELNKKLVKLIKKIFKFEITIFDWNNYEFKEKDPRITDKIGADLLADIVGAKQIYGYPCMVMDLGTVNKLLLIDNKGIFVGASFNPGMEISLKLFGQNTSLLPSLDKVSSMSERTGLSTVESMHHGVYWETVSYIRHEQKAQEELNKMPIKLILTGGNSPLVQKEIENKVYDPLLTLKGMNILFKEAQK